MPRGCQKTNETVNDTATQQVPDKLKAHLIIISINTCL